MEVKGNGEGEGDGVKGNGEGEGHGGERERGGRGRWGEERFMRQSVVISGWGTSRLQQRESRKAERTERGGLR
jgi:hypothetical protein